jgi:hypothetical protein
MHILKKDDTQQALIFTSKTFVNEPASATLNLSPQDFNFTFEHVMEESVISGYSLAITDEKNDIVCQTLLLPFDKMIEVEYGYLESSAEIFLMKPRGSL